MTTRALVLGGGLGGLAAAISLRNAGAEPTVLERNSPDRMQFGFGMMVWPNGMRALKELGIADQVMAAGAEISNVEFRTPAGKRLMMWPVRELAAQIGCPAVAISRAGLHSVLSAELGSEPVRLNSWVTGVEQDAGRAVAHVRDQADLYGDIAIAADGVRSNIRGDELGLRWPEFPPYAGYSITHTIVHNANVDLPIGLFVQFLGRGERIVCTRIDETRIYWSALTFVPEGGVEADTDPLARVRERFQDWAEPIKGLLAQSDPARVARRDIFGGRELPRWGQGRLTLLGDAAHPMTTVLGQGGCMALEDAAVLGRMVRTHQDPVEALRAYELRRMERTSEMMSVIRRFNPGKPESAMKVHVRNSAIRFAFRRGIGGSYERLILQAA